jgi:hypothetical protein
MKTLLELGVSQLERALAIRRKIEALHNEMAEVLGEKIPIVGKIRRTMSASARSRIAAAQKLRWAKLKGVSNIIKAKRTMSTKTRAAMAAAAKERWKKAKAAGKNAL